MKTIFKRTAKGDEEIKRRTYKLAHEYRFILIMIDGKADVANLISRSSKQWHPRQCLYEMESQGFIENIDESKQSNLSISQLKQDLILHIKRKIPQNNEKIVNKIVNSSMLKKELTDAINSCCVFVKLTISEETAKQLKTDLHNILDSSTEI